MNATPLPVPSERRYDFDWLRVLLIVVVFVFHSLHFFDPDYWHVKNAATHEGVAILMLFISRWMMPGIFLVSGVATFYYLGKRGAGPFLRDRALRLLVPLVVGCVTHAAWQVYLERLNHNQFTGSFWQYYPTYFNGLDRLGGDFRWMGNHLWYLEMLFVISLVTLPLLIWLRRGSGQRALAWIGERLSAPGAVYLLIVPTLLVLYGVNGEAANILVNDDWGGWNLPSYIVFFLAGFLLASSPGMQASIRRVRWISLAAGALTFIVGGGLYFVIGDQPFGSPQYLLMISFSGVVAWCWVLAIFGFGLGRLNFRTPLLDYANEAVLPFYILHQTVLLTVGFSVVMWPIPDFLKWILIVAISFVLIMAIYEFLIRRWNVVRVLFGMKTVQKEKLVHKPAAQVS